MVRQRLDLALGQKRVELQREAGARQHVVDRHVDGLRQAHAAEFLGRGDADPAALCDRRESPGETGRGAHHAVFQPRRHLVAVGVDRRHDRVAELGGLGQDRLDRRGRGFREPFGRGDRAEGHDMVKQEADVGEGGTIGHQGLPAGALAFAAPARMTRNRNCPQ